MKDRYKMLIFWLILFNFGLFAMPLTLEMGVKELEHYIANYPPYPEGSTCLGCCSLECLEEALETQQKMILFYPYFFAFLILSFLLVIVIVGHLEIKSERRSKIC